MLILSVSFFFNDPATTELYTLSLHDALPISTLGPWPSLRRARARAGSVISRKSSTYWRATVAQGSCLAKARSEEHTSELQSRPHLVCRLLLEKKNTLSRACSRRHCV